MEMKVLTFNLRVDLPQDGLNAWPYRIENAAKTIQKHKPLVFGTQEMLLGMIRDLDEYLPEYQWVGEGRRGGMEDEFCPVFYNARILDKVKNGQFWLSEQPKVPNSISWNSDFPRICTWGHFRYKHEPNQEFVVFNTHLDHVSQSAREKGIVLIWENLLHFINKNIPSILTGDLNSNPDNNVIQFLRGVSPIDGVTAHLQDTFSVTDADVGRTFHDFEGGITGEPIDYIFCTSDFKVLKTEVDRNKYGEAYPSDHYPVSTTLEI
ncbi:endonuclease/exonuclease/phosphatase family protein [Thalassobacillus pellis]|uniref:endonuclease/exonuclease/phosphatase family protein n=1 Tax=Thalassobacillus pellis TaxID=748008 RepID=UPI0019608F1A|nr:endonuclease/exonuclease/phosphatase family protein [Thalassobacillus pellis]MBM7553177.1 endonuclease/exonuclease/phosphatase family metal-dependent hydrolase [Thalassobacillus pellis]